MAGSECAGAGAGHAGYTGPHDHSPTGAIASAAKCPACNNLMQYGIPYSLTTLHTEAPGFA